MKLINVHAVNFFSLGDVQVDLAVGGITLVEGINHDSPADSNGAGKSSIFESIVWCLFGITRRGLKGDDIINRHVKGGAACAVRFGKWPKLFSVVRTRKFGKVGTVLRFFEGLVEIDAAGKRIDELGSIELTKGTMADTQAYIEEIMGVGQITLQKAVYFGQGDVKPFASLTDSELKIVFEQALSLTVVSEDAAKVSGFRKGLESEISRLQISVDSAVGKLGIVESQIESAKEIIASFEDDKRKKIEALSAEFAALESGLKGADEEYAELTKKLNDYIKQRDITAAKIAAMSGIGEKIRAASEKITSGLARATELRRSLLSSGEETAGKAAKVKGRLGEECEICGGFKASTNNRMEMMAAIFGLYHASKIGAGLIELYSDSQYLVNGVGYLDKWISGGWKTSDKTPVKNQDLWIMIDAFRMRYAIDWRWVKGHASNPFNNRCDELAGVARRGENLLIDRGFKL